MLRIIVTEYRSVTTDGLDNVFFYNTPSMTLVML